MTYSPNHYTVLPSVSVVTNFVPDNTPPDSIKKNSLVGSASIKSVRRLSVGRNLAQPEQSADGSHTNSCVSVVQVYAMVEQHLIQ